MAHSNDEWKAALTGTPSEAHVEELHAVLRRGLARALAGRGEVGDHDLDDFTQDAITQVLDRIDSFEGRSRFTTWAVSIAIRTAFTELRRKRWGDVSIEALDIPERRSADEGSAGAEKSELATALRRAIDEDLTDRQRTAILAELAGMPSAVLAEQLGTNANALYKLYFDARKRLKESLERAGFRRQDLDELTTPS